MSSTVFALEGLSGFRFLPPPKLLLGRPKVPQLTERMLDRQADRDRLVKTDSQIDAGRNPWLWSRKQCQMLLVMPTYNHLVRHVSPRASRYILYTRAESAL